MCCRHTIEIDRLRTMTKANPQVEAIILPRDGLYGGVKPLMFSLLFNENVFIGEATPRLPVEVGYRLRHAEYVKGSGTNTLEFTLNTTPEDLDLDGVSLGTVDPLTGIRNFNFSSSIADAQGNPVSDIIPNVNTKNILIDAKGPEVISHSNLMLQHSGIELQVVLEVNFAQDVFVTGEPLVPVQLGVSLGSLKYASGSGSKTLVFTATVPKTLGITDVVFRDMTGQVIYLPEGANIRDQLGNSIELLGADYNKTLIEDGNRVAVIGAHYEHLGTIKTEDLDQNMLTEKEWYLNGAAIDSNAPPGPGNIQSYLRNYELPPFKAAINDVDLYRVAFRSSIPEQDRFVTAYGIVGIPKSNAESIPVVSWEHQTSFNKKYAASQALSFKPEDPEYSQTLSTRLKLAHYAGQGYAMISADQFGLGNSTENYAYQVKKSNQQASLDLYLRALDLIESLGKSSSALYLSGWSGGGVTVAGFLEQLEAKGIKVKGTAVAAGPWDQEMLMSAAIFSPRDGADGNTPDASWLNYLLAYTAFSLSGYNGKASVAEDTLGKYYEAARRLYTGEYKEFKQSADRKGLLIDGLYLPNQVIKILPEKYTSDPAAFAKSPYAQLLREASSGSIPLSGDVMMVYGRQDELMSPDLAVEFFERQSIGLGKKNISLDIVESANHRAAFFSLMHDSLAWFDAKLVLPDGYAPPKYRGKNSLAQGLVRGLEGMPNQLVAAKGETNAVLQGVNGFADTFVLRPEWNIFPHLENFRPLEGDRLLLDPLAISQMRNSPGLKPRSTALKQMNYDQLDDQLVVQNLYKFSEDDVVARSDLRMEALDPVTSVTLDQLSTFGGLLFDLVSRRPLAMLSDQDANGKDLAWWALSSDLMLGAIGLLPQLTNITSNQGLLTLGAPISTSGTSPFVWRASLIQRPASANQIIYVVLEPGELEQAASLLEDINLLKSRAKLLFTSLESTNTCLPDGIAFEQEITLMEGQSLRFFEIQDSELNALFSSADNRLNPLDPMTAVDNGGQITLVSNSGLTLILQMQDQQPSVGTLIADQQISAPMLNFTSPHIGTTLQGSVAVSREADYDAITGFYRIRDVLGSVRTLDGLGLIKPGEPGYAEAALSAANQVSALSNLRVGNMQTRRFDFSITEMDMIAPFAVVHGNTFFAFAGANPDGINHFRSLGKNIFGLEDMFGGGDRDYDDQVMSFTFTAASQ